MGMMTENVEVDRVTMPLAISRYTVSVVPERPIDLPRYTGGMIRGVLGHGLKRAACMTGTGACESCALRALCAYWNLFDTPPGAGARIMRKYPHVPQPWVLEPPAGGYRHPAGTPLTIGVTFVGRARHQAPYFFAALERMGRVGLGGQRVPYRMGAVQAMPMPAWVMDGNEASGAGLARAADGELVVPLGAPALDGVQDERITIEFLTPTRIVVDGALTDQISFPALLRGVLRRIALLSYFHCGGNPDPVPFRQWIELAGRVQTTRHSLRWVEWTHYSARQRVPMQLGGVMGMVEYEGPVGAFLPVLRVGSVVHVGKNVSFGLGRYRIMEPAGCSG